ncbi:MULTISPECIES: TIGR03750 family conjugal transfer protein [Pseudomonas]|uniref:TIGR03750 family conjugal transfer protein n=1 Tax=Pseudomonas TaxID=286 RepID=UPI000F84D00B|nr:MULTISPECIES: TIGR03750 family conjugal transfer protein [Pseudomonas]MBK3443095.1 TIGR03750 family conjugal transfer protein [Pseudomonas lactis]RTY69782.1 TIGR03750 family conjugal transfer protein [Pseudomonas veronii]
MNDTIERLTDGTLVFLPERLNRDPAVLRGLTNDEMWIALGSGALAGLVLGVPLAIATASIAVAPTSMIASMAVMLFAGGTLLRRAKRARPETWLYRKLEWILASRWRLGSGNLILHSGAWTVRRSRRLCPALSRWRP